MNKIKLLPKEVYSKIAAGEVIDRPASVVRELIDNSIDALADEISIMIEKGGIDKIIIADNGSGIDKDDIELAFSMHATSKIKNIDDLFKINSMGFRGEALHSIKTVSKITLTTNTDASGKLAGSRISNLKGKLDVIENVPFKKGTKVEISDLFYNLPARKKFLKSPVSEWNFIKKTVAAKALSNLNISFNLYHNNQRIFATMGDGNFTNAFFNIYGNENPFLINEEKIEINDDIKIHAYYTDPDVFFQNRKYMEIFVNKRPVWVNFFYAAVDSAYRSFLSPGRYPLVYLNLDIDPRLIDINIHPAKREIKFFDQNEIFKIIHDSLKHLLNKKLNRELINENYEITEQNNQLKFSFGINENDKNSKYFNEVLNTGYIKNPVEDIVNEYIKNDNERLNKFNILATVFDTYIIVQKEDKVIFIDQHAACESVIFNRKKNKYQKNPDIEKLIIPILFDLDNPGDDLEERIISLNKNGFLIELQEGLTIVIKEAPSILLERKNYDIIVEIIKNFLENVNNYNKINLLDEILIELSCKEAVKKGDKLSLIELNEIVNEYFENKVYNCPHGRPIHFEITNEYLEKIFQRKI
ncbi:MAG: DNA mismatch repair endonuclease MutL [Spirochaetes bacterium]|nr:DNA mismatch repair endonuclease MutL [Spirochaetota bacterium]